MKNFLSFGEEEQEIVFDKINTIVGPNDAGKTNIFRAISLVDQYLTEDTIQDEPYYHNGDLTKLMEIQLTIKFNDEEIEAFSNFLIGSALHEVPTVQKDELREKAVLLIEKFILKNAKRLAEDLFKQVTIIVKRREDRRLSKGDHALILGDKEHKMFFRWHGRISIDEENTSSEYRFPEACLEILRKKDPANIGKYLKDHSGSMPEIDFGEDELSHLFFNFLGEKQPPTGIGINGFRFAEGRLRERIFPELLILRKFLRDRGHNEEQLNLLDIISIIFTSSIVRTSDLRSKPKSFLLPENKIESYNLHDLSGENLPLILFNLWNSTKPSYRRRYNEILEKFKEISNETGFYVGIESKKIKHKGSPSIIPISEEQNRIDGVVPAGIRQEDIETIQNELVIRFVKEDMAIPLEFAAAGRFDSLLLLVAIIGQSEKVILLDEPAANIHPLLQRRILDEIENSTSDPLKNQILMITHSPYLINPNHLGNIWRISTEKDNSKIINIKQALKGLKQFEESRIITQLQESDIRSILFSKGVVLVEGLSDKIVVEKIDKHLSKNGSGADLEKNDWSIIEIGGKYSLGSFIKLATHLSLPFIGIMDNDALMRCEKILKTERSKFLTSAIPICLYSNDLLKNNTIDDLLNKEKIIKKYSDYDERKKRNVEQSWYPEEERSFLNQIAKSNHIFVFSKDLEDALQNPLNKKQSKPLKDLNAVIEKIGENKIPTEFYSMTEFIRKNMN